MGETTYISEVEIRFPIVLKTDEGEYMKRKLTAYIIDAERVNFLLGRESIKELVMMLVLSGDIIVFKKKGMKVETVESKGGHSVVDLEFVGKWEDSDAIYLLEKEDDVRSDQAIKNIYKTLNHKSKEQIISAYKIAGKLDKEIRKKNK